MNIVSVHNAYAKFSGEEAVVQNIRRLLEENGHKVFPFMRSSAEIPRMWLGNERAFFSGIYSWSSKNALRRCLEEFKPDIVHVQNVFPLISPSVLGECRRFGVPVVMTTHNFRLICPNGLFMTDGEVCEKCSGGREYWCVLRNCQRNLFKSFGYALRNYVSRKRRMCFYYMPFGSDNHFLSYPIHSLLHKHHYYLLQGQQRIRYPVRVPFLCPTHAIHDNSLDRQLYL